MKRYQIIIITFLVLIIPINLYASGRTNTFAQKTDPYGYPIFSIPYPEIRQLLKEQKYEELNTILDNYQLEFEKDFRNEYKVYSAYRTFYAPVSAYRKLLDDWVNKCPNSYQSHLARAFYLDAMGWESRGYGWANETSTEQFKKMRENLAAARQDTDFVLKSKPRAICVYYLLIEINATAGSKNLNKGLIKTALKRFSYSYLIRSVYLDYTRPIWGGTYSDMDKFAADAQKYVDKNPRLRLLKGYSYMEMGWRALDRKNYWLAYIFFNISLWYGENWDAYIGESDCYLHMNNRRSALAVINRSIEINPQSERSYTMRAEVNYKLGKYKESVSDIKTAYQIAPNNIVTRDVQLWIAQSLVHKGSQLYQLKKYDKAITVFTWAIKIKSDNPNTYCCRGEGYCALYQLQLASNDFNKAIHLNPRYFVAYKDIDWVLCHSGQWDKIISYWTQYIALEPKDGRAYRERGGTYFHKGDMRAAVADAKKAADLGDKEGRKIYERFKDSVKY